MKEIIELDKTSGEYLSYFPFPLCQNEYYKILFNKEDSGKDISFLLN